MTPAKKSSVPVARAAEGPGPSSATLAEKRYARAFREFKRGHFQLALTLFSLLLIDDPLNARFLIATGACLQRLHRYEDALRHYCLCAAFSPGEFLSQLYAAQCLIALQRPRQASAVC